MRKRDKKKERREIFGALAMVTQIGLAMMTCMGISFAIGYYIDRLFGTKIWVMIFLIIGILSSIRSLFILTGKMRGVDSEGTGREESNEGSKKDTH